MLATIREWLALLGEAADALIALNAKLGVLLFIAISYPLTCLFAVYIVRLARRERDERGLKELRSSQEFTTMLAAGGMIEFVQGFYLWRFAFELAMAHAFIAGCIANIVGKGLVWGLHSRKHPRQAGEPLSEVELALRRSLTLDDTTDLKKRQQ